MVNSQSQGKGLSVTSGNYPKLFARKFPGHSLILLNSIRFVVMHQIQGGPLLNHDDDEQDCQDNILKVQILHLPTPRILYY